MYNNITYKRYKNMLTPLRSVKDSTKGKNLAQSVQTLKSVCSQKHHKLEQTSTISTAITFN